MKKILVVLSMLASAALCHAEPITFDLGAGMKFIVPLQVVNAIQMYSFEDQHGFTGAETTLLSHGNLRLNIGAATGYRNGVQFPFLSFDTKLSDMLFDTSNNDLRFGLFCGRDFDAKHNVYGLAASIQLW